MMMMIELRLLSLLGLKFRWHRHFSLRPLSKVFFRGVGCRWNRGVLAQNPCAIGIQPIHTRVESRGVAWSPATGDSTKSNVAGGRRSSFPDRSGEVRAEWQDRRKTP